jgi:His Kinase A (phospho-acceptor) domain
MFERINTETRAPVATEPTTLDRRQAGEAGRPPTGPGGGVACGSNGEPPRCAGDPLPSASWPRLCHDLRTPLNAILGNTELLLDGSAGPLSSQARACVGDIQTAGSGMMRQVQVLLDLCRVRAIPVPAAALDLDLLALLRSAHAAARQGTPVMEVVPADARLVVRGDPAWLGTLAATLIELHPAGEQTGAPSVACIERPPHREPGATLRFFWADFRPHEVAALPLALIAAILDLHEGTTALSGDGLRLYWPASRLVQLEPSAPLVAHDRKSV